MQEDSNSLKLQVNMTVNNISVIFHNKRLILNFIIYKLDLFTTINSSSLRCELNKAKSSNFLLPKYFI